MTDVPHFALPFRWTSAGSGGLSAAETEQESDEEIMDCCEAVLRTVQGQRTTLPQFGHPQVEFSPSPELTRSILARSLLDGEPRAPSAIEGAVDPNDPEVQIMRALIGPGEEELT